VKRKLTPFFDRALAAFYGLAIGDALGMPTQNFTQSDIYHRFPDGITKFEPAPADQPITPNYPAGTITDDTEQALIVAKLLIAGKGQINQKDFAKSLASWHKQKIKNNTADALGPSTLKALELLKQGDPNPGRFGDTNGAAMRITPVAIAHPPTRLTNLVETKPAKKANYKSEHFTKMDTKILSRRITSPILNASILTHNTGNGLASATAVGLMISSLIDGSQLVDAVDNVQFVTDMYNNAFGFQVGAYVSERLAYALSNPLHPWATYTMIGTSSKANESIPAVFSLLNPLLEQESNINQVTLQHLAYDQLLTAASLGGDTDTIAAMFGAIIGARFGMHVFPADMIETVKKVNTLKLEELVQQLLKIRCSGKTPDTLTGTIVGDPPLPEL
jgi:ADP-ribosylglycohydrolase